ncbi:hypothetical protein [Hahella sp. HN01]|uniref:hypothetical protein n=1 Tax=Hahella sp. HN01 TaxID=2847262 RepID=UPI001C1F1ADE|nr:hypothetical protein [Hahella sp. HN01]MBU6953444.1 hypothetical protein [Hahella sp. HN01]
MISPVPNQLCKESREDGPTLRRFIIDTELKKLGSVGHTIGVEYEYSNEDYSLSYWVIFFGITVYQCYPSRVHDYWHRMPPFSEAGFCFVSDPSDLIRKLEESSVIQGQKHYILEFEDDVIEVVCDRLVFGEGEFKVENFVAANTNIHLHNIVGRF